MADQETVEESKAPPAPQASVTEETAPPEKVKQVPPQVLERVGEKKNLEDISEDELKAILKEYYDRWIEQENEVYDIAHVVRVKDMQIHELEMEVSDMRGKFIIPKLKKVHNFKLMGDND